MTNTSNFWQNRPVFITGGTGLLGGWLVQYLLNAGADIVCLVRDWIPQSFLVQSGVLEKVKVVRGDIVDQCLIQRILEEYEIDTVIHLAAQTVVGVANRNPISTFETNIAGTWRLLEACRYSCTVKQIVVASSDKAYGQQTQLPYDEKTPLQGTHPYDVSKSCADLITQAYANTYNLPVAIARCGNFYGGGDLNWSRIVPGTIQSILNGEPPLIRSNGLFVRDYLYVEDGARAYMLLAESLSQQPDLIGEAFNFSLEIKLTVLELVEKILKLMGSNLQPQILNHASHEITHQYLSSQKARKILNWYPLFDLETGLEKTINWYQELLK
ncbi:GDP-mannose 4,6-dehydratase [Sphaerospermopsis sp. FACHB-1094]|uniref:NAD-dependent epimerase/dehydratase family protein n=1 Tax=Sphaerospermopsis sp. FACHB-1094 TaxID=2692861 RepID=UPI001687D20B|nr:NAD-dependent epimerase/dehydratase family protein [Sphaerospermopsis sp. FACHB-1094]MBD2134060.1 GDP-mannose 4,6-dehydratase [Sphaerospermopsis sp. FACHB-1094]